MPARIAPFAFGVIALVLAGCAGGQATDSVTTEPTAGASSVRGQVTDVATGQPIVGATVTFRDATGASGMAMTGEDGVYSFDGITSPQPEAGLADFKVSAPGYIAFIGIRDVQYDDETQTLGVLNFELIPESG